MSAAAIPAIVRPLVKDAEQRSMSNRWQRFARLVSFAILWAVAITAVEAPNIPFASENLGEVLRVFATLFTDFAAVALFFAVAFHWAEARQIDGLKLAALVVATSIGASAFTATIVPKIFIVGHEQSMGDSIVGRSSNFALMIWLCWMGLVYGGVAAAIFSLRRGINQTSRALADATLARERNEAAIAEARMQAMVERIEPAFLLDVMDSARRRYATDIPRAEGIINECVEFLRTAMPQIRSGRSTLEAELDVAEAFLALRALTIDDCPPWSIHRGDDPALLRNAARLALPPLVLLPVLERLMTPLPAGSRVTQLRIELRGTADGIVVAITSPSNDRSAVEAERLAAITSRLQRACDGRIVLSETPQGHLLYEALLPIHTPYRPQPGASRAQPQPHHPRLETAR